MPINLTKGSAPVTLTKASKITLKCSWSSHTDYDLYALVLYKDGRTETVATFPAKDSSGRKIPAQKKTKDGAVRHGGDVGRLSTGDASETISVEMRDDIAAVVAVAYSAQSNGTGSFQKYKVSMEVDGGNGEQVVISSVDASSNSLVYTCVPGLIVNTPEGVRVHAAELYSRMSSENRPVVRFGDGNMGKKGLFGKVKGDIPSFDGVEVVRDAGPRNVYK